MYITQVLFKRVFILLEFFRSDGLGLAADSYFKDSFSEFLACKVPSSVWHEHVRNCKKFILSINRNVYQGGRAQLAQ